MLSFNYSTHEMKMHLKEEHNISSISSYLREIIYGGSDGIVTTFAVVAGFSGASGGSFSPEIPVMTVLIFGLANLFADATSMSLGNFLSLRADQDVYKNNAKKERNEIRDNIELEWIETVHILKGKGFDEKDAREIANLYKKNEGYWLDFMMNNELDMSNPEKESAVKTSIATFFSFVSFGFIPLVPYFFFRSSSSLFLISIVFTLTALVLLGLLRQKVTRVTMFRSVGEIVLLGSTSALIAYLVGSLFRI